MNHKRCQSIAANLAQVFVEKYVTLATQKDGHLLQNESQNAVKLFKKKTTTVFTLKWQKSHSGINSGLISWK